MIRILLADAISPKAIESLKEIPEFELMENAGLSSDELKKEIQNVDGMVVRGTTNLNREILAEAAKLKIIVRAGIGLENIDLEFAKTKNIDVRNTPHATSITVAEYTLAHMLGICRNIGPAYASMKNKKWEKSRFSKGMELHGKTAGIIGFGRIGSEVAMRELCMGMSVLCYDVADIQTDLNVRQVPLDTLLKESDFISVHLPLTKNTRNLLSFEEFNKMKSTAVLVNVASGGVVDEEALVQALDERKIGAVAVDVFQTEPPNNFSLINHERVFPAPHLGASTQEGQERAGIDAVSILKEFFNV